MKEELIGLREWTSPLELIIEVGEWFESYNTGYLHSMLGYKTPDTAEKEYENSSKLPISTTC
jgi:putative transposase